MLWKKSLLGMLPLLFLLLLLIDESQSQIEGRLRSCTNEGEEVRVGIIADDPCFKCFCTGGYVQCVQDRCLELQGCHFILYRKPKDSCCQVCKGCVDDGKHYSSGEVWETVSEGQCTVKECKAGVVTKSSPVCHVPCSNPIQKPGQCCPSCSGCTVNGTEFENGESFPLAHDSCTTCQCKDDVTVCHKRACPVLNCKPQDLEYPTASACCPVCKGSQKVFDISNHCFFRRSVYKSGVSVQVDSCTQCSCEGSTMKCERNTCPVLSCPLSLQKAAAAGECCPTCPDAVAIQCSDRGSVYKVGDTWERLCEVCRCTAGGEVNCEPEQCQIDMECPSTHQLGHVPGQCCRACVEKHGVCTVFGDPHYTTFDDVTYDFQGGCKYTLAKDCGKSGPNGLPAFSVSARNYARYNMPSVAWTKAVFIHVTGAKSGARSKITLLPGGKVRVNKLPVGLPFEKTGEFTVQSLAGHVLVETSIGLRIVWNGASYLEIHAPPRFRRHTCGLCGNFNGVKTDEFIGRDNRMYTSPIKFAESWRYGTKACGDAASGTTSHPSSCETNQTLWTITNKRCNVMHRKAFKICSEKVDPGPYIKSCLKDVCNCPTAETGRRCSCDSITAYVRECERHGVPISHRLISSCSLEQVTLRPKKKKTTQSIEITPSPAVRETVTSASALNWLEEEQKSPAERVGGGDGASKAPDTPDVRGLLSVHPGDEGTSFTMNDTDYTNIAAVQNISRKPHDGIGSEDVDDDDAGSTNGLLAKSDGLNISEVVIKKKGVASTSAEDSKEKLAKKKATRRKAKQAKKRAKTLISRSEGRSKLSESEKQERKRRRKLLAKINVNNILSILPSLVT